MEKKILKEEIIDEKDFVVELSGLLDKKLLSTNLNQANFLEIQSQNPVLQINNLLFQGTFEPFLGTAVCFQSSPQQKDPNKPTTSNVDESSDQNLKFIVKQTNCNLWLQMALYFNFYYSIVWICFHFLTISLQFNNTFDLGLFLKFTTLTIASTIELPRIYLGYLGNLQSLILCCVGFWLLTLLIQMPIMIFVLCSSLIKFSIFELIMHIILLTFHLIEFIFGFKLLRNLIIDVI